MMYDADMLCFCAACRVPVDSSKHVHDGRLPFLKCLEQFVSPEQYANKVLDKYKHKFAWGKYGG